MSVTVGVRRNVPATIAKKVPISGSAAACVPERLLLGLTNSKHARQKHSTGSRTLSSVIQHSPFRRTKIKYRQKTH